MNFYAVGSRNESEGVVALSVSVQKIRNKLWKFKGEVIVDTQRVSECEFSAMMRI